MRSQLMATFIFLFGLFGIVGGNQDDAVKQEMKRLEGVWQLTSLKLFGEESKDKRDKEAEYSFKGNKFQISRKSDDEETMQVYRLDLTKNPRHFDLESPSGPVKGIYSLKGDVLTICLPLPFVTKERPTKLESGLDGEAVLMVLKRVKP